MHQKISDVTVLTIIVSTVMLLFLGSIVIYFLFAYQKKIHRHQEELLVLNETFQKTLLMSKLEIQEQTLDHIAKELHANISHLVSVININLSTYLRQQGEGAHENITESKLLVKQLMAELKGLSATLNTEHIGRAGFRQMLLNELERLKKTGLYDIWLDTSGEECRMAAEKEIILFRLCQEILNNIIKHADADTIRVALQYEDELLTVSISDNGIGFDLAETEQKAGQKNSTGIHNIYHRSGQIDGQVTIDSRENKGTTITVKIPV